MGCMFLILLKSCLTLISLFWKRFEEVTGIFSLQHFLHYSSYPQNSFENQSRSMIYKRIQEGSCVATRSVVCNMRHRWTYKKVSNGGDCEGSALCHRIMNWSRSHISYYFPGTRHVTWINVGGSCAGLRGSNVSSDPPQINRFTRDSAAEIHYSNSYRFIIHYQTFLFHGSILSDHTYGLLGFSMAIYCTMYTDRVVSFI